MSQMRILAVLLCGGLLIGHVAQAHGHSNRTSALIQPPPAQAMLNALNSMTRTLNRVENKSTADAAAPTLLRLHQEYLIQSNAAENTPEMPEPALTQHMVMLDKALNNFRLACIRLQRKKCYGSSRLREAIRKVVRDF